MLFNKDKNCKFTIYVDRPSMMIPKKARRRLNAPINEATLTDSGHVFIGLTDENGVEQRIGFYAKSHAFGPENVAPEDRLENPLKDGFKKVGGLIRDETSRNYNDAIEYSISRKQYDKAFKYIEDWKARDTKYVFLVNNCVAFSLKTAMSIGLKTPPQIILGIPSPHSTSLCMQIKEGLDKISVIPSKIAKKLHNFFGGSGKVVEILNQKTSKNNDSKTTIEHIANIRSKLIR